MWKVHRWRLSCFLLILGDTEDQNGVSAELYGEWPLHTWVNSPYFRWLRVTFGRILAKAPVEYPEPVEDEASNEELLHQSEDYTSALSYPPPPRKVVLSVLGQTKILI